MLVKSEVAKIKKKVSKLHERSIIPKFVIMEVVPEVYIENFWEILDLIEEP